MIEGSHITLSGVLRQMAKLPGIQGDTARMTSQNFAMLRLELEAEGNVGAVRALEGDFPSFEGINIRVDESVGA